MDITTVNELVEVLVRVALIPAIAALGKFLYSIITKYVEEKTKNIKDEKTRNYVRDAVKAVLTAVDSTFQTYVDSLKKSGNFTSEEAHKEAFDRAKNIALTMLTQEMREAIRITYGDLDVWLNNVIEQLVGANKKDNKEDTVLALIA